MVYCNGNEKMYKGGTMKKDRKAVRFKRKSIRDRQKVNNIEYIHYGSSRFDPLLITDEGTNMACINKPNAGLWASPVNSNCGWKDWCESEQFYKNDFSKYFVFKLKPKTKILTIRSLEDWNDVLADVYTNNPKSFDSNFIEIRYAVWEYIQSNFDAILVIMNYNYSEMHNSFEFNSWDCDSIVVFNPEVVNIVRHSA